VILVAGSLFRPDKSGTVEAADTRALNALPPQ
jgi:hypothetical protein